MGFINSTVENIGNAIGDFAGGILGKNNRMSDASAAALADKMLGGDTKLTAEQKAVLTAAKENTDAKQMKKGGAVKASSASRRADGVAQRGKTRGKMI